MAHGIDPAIEPQDQALDPGERQRATLLAAIDFEIDTARLEVARPGWSQWAFAAAIAAVVWGLIDQVESGRYVQGVALLLTVYGFLLAHGLRIAWAAWQGGTSDEDSPRRFRFANTLRQSRPDFPLTFLLWGAALFAHVSLAPLVAGALWWVATLALGLFTLLSVFGLVAMFTSFPIPIYTGRWPGIAALAQMALGIALLALAIHTEPSAAALSARSVLLSLALIYLTEGFLRQPGQASQLMDLEELRRGVALDGMDPAAAFRQLQILVRGADVSEVVRPQVDACLRAIAAAEREVRACIGELRSLGDLLGRKSGPLDDAEQQLAKSIAESQRHRLEVASSARRSAVEAYQRLKARMGQLGRMRPSELRVIESLDAFILERDRGIDKLAQERVALAKLLEDSIARRIRQVPRDTGNPERP